MAYGDPGNAHSYIATGAQYNIQPASGVAWVVTGAASASWTSSTPSGTAGIVHRWHNASNYRAALRFYNDSNHFSSVLRQVVTNSEYLEVQNYMSATYLAASWVVMDADHAVVGQLLISNSSQTTITPPSGQEWVITSVGIGGVPIGTRPDASSTPGEFGINDGTYLSAIAYYNAGKMWSRAHKAGFTNTKKLYIWNQQGATQYCGYSGHKTKGY